MSQSTNHPHYDQNFVLQAASDALKAANTWKAHVPFLFSDSHHSQNYSMAGALSMVNPRFQDELMCKKELFRANAKPLMKHLEFCSRMTYKEYSKTIGIVWSEMNVQMMTLN